MSPTNHIERRARKASSADAYERVDVQTRTALRRWLERYHATSPGMWLVRTRKENARTYLDYDAIVEELLCFGWIDGKVTSLDETRSMLLCTPRRSKSGWSKLNKERIARLEALGKLRPAGRAIVDEAKATGSWAALDEVEALVVPPDLADALERHAPATTHFEAFPRSVKRAILEWISQAKRAETRTKRIDETARLAAKNQRANQWPR